MAQPGAGDGRAFGFLRLNERQAKRRSVGVTEIRGPYYTPMGRRYLQDILETVGAYVDALKFASRAARSRSCHAPRSPSSSSSATVTT